MNERLDYLREKSNRLPLRPGVYLMKDSGGNIIYVGKAKALKNRVTSYFHSVENHNIKTYKLVEKINDFDFIVCPSELDALVLEASLIKLHQPRYNILLKDAKGFNYIKITTEEYPSISYALNTADKNAEYIGPYTSGFTVRQTIDDANKIFKLRTCSKKFPRDFRKERPCLNYQIKRCMGVCQGKISAESYKETVEAAIDYIKNGSKGSTERLTEEMNAAAELLDFERAARLRDRINAITRVENSQKIVSDKQTDYDIVALAQNVEMASVAVVKYRGGRLIDKDSFYIGEEYEPAQMRSDFLLEYYSRADDMPKEILLDCEIEDRELLEQYFRDKAGHKVAITVPKRGEGLTQITLAKANAGEYLALKVGRTVKEIDALDGLRTVLGLDKIPKYIESYDISNMGEQTRVAGMIVYRNGRPFKEAYRKFTIKEVVGIDDYACMQEVLRRRFTHYLAGDEGFSTLPDLILLDGGKGHVSAVREVLDELHINVRLFGLVKDDKHRTRAVAMEGGEIQISANKSVFKLLTEIQDEVHRFSINFQRQRHKKTSYELELVRVNGIGEAKAAALLKHFKTKQALKDATRDELMSVAKVSETVADDLYVFIREMF